MKTSLCMLSTGLALAVGLLSAQSLNAGNDPTLASIKKSLSNAKAIDLPAEAASIVSSAKNQSSVADLVIQAVARLRPVAMPTVVGAIIMQTPSVGNEIVATADKLLPVRKDAIHEAAAFAARCHQPSPPPPHEPPPPPPPPHQPPPPPPHQPPPPPPPGHYERPC